jgi:cardiolipin synthase
VNIPIPNILSIIRLALVPAFVVVFFSESPNAQLYAGLIFILASLTDALDGFIARRFNMVTRLGRILDPLADKLMTVSALLCVTVAGLIPAWIVVVFAVKEALMGIGALIMYKRVDDVLPSNTLGKMATLAFIVSCVALMLFSIPKPYSTVLLTIPLALTLIAFGRYAVLFYETIFAKRNKT